MYSAGVRLTTNDCLCMFKSKTRRMAVPEDIQASLVWPRASFSVNPISARLQLVCAGSDVTALVTLTSRKLSIINACTVEMFDTLCCLVQLFLSASEEYISQSPGIDGSQTEHVVTFTGFST